jgi:hypothetical protein
MTHIHPTYLQHERKQFVRNDAHRFLRADWQRYMRVAREHDPLFCFFSGIERKYSPGQPRVPRGSSNGGQWTSEGANGRNDPRVISDATSDPERPATQYAQNRPRGSFASVIINGQWVEPTPGQQARLAVFEGQAREAVQRVRELDPKWQPAPSAYESVEGLIRAYQSDAQQARDRISELQQFGIGPGPFAGESIPARGPERNFQINERNQLNEIGSGTGCHTCGTRSPGTTSGNFVADHQPPTALNFSNKPQRLYPQCVTCSWTQGGWIAGRGAKK